MVTFDICENNPGCIQFIAQAYAIDMIIAENAFNRMQLNFITGDKLYMLWNDCLERNTDDALLVMKADTIESINEHINYDHGRGIPYTEEELESMRLNTGDFK